MTTSATPHLFWLTSRAAGIVALVLASLAVSLGLLMSTKLLRRRGPDLLAVHEILSISTLVAIAVHGLTLLGDQYVHLSIVDIAVPFASGYKTFWTSLGIIGGWGLALLGLSFYLRRHIGATRWRKLHRLTAVMWLAGLVHALGEGTDAGQIWFLAMIALVAVPALALLATRWLGGQGQPSVPSAARGEGLDVHRVRTGAVPTPGVPVRPAGDPVAEPPGLPGRPVVPGRPGVAGRPVGGGALAGSVHAARAGATRGTPAHPERPREHGVRPVSPGRREHSPVSAVGPPARDNA